VTKMSDDGCLFPVSPGTEFYENIFIKFAKV
jgi:hypothetical protein